IKTFSSLFSSNFACFPNSQAMKAVRCWCMASEENARSKASERERTRFPRFTDIFGYIVSPVNELWFVNIVCKMITAAHHYSLKTYEYIMCFTPRLVKCRHLPPFPQRFQLAGRIQDPAARFPIHTFNPVVAHLDGGAV